MIPPKASVSFRVAIHPPFCSAPKKKGKSRYAGISFRTARKYPPKRENTHQKRENAMENAPPKAKKHLKLFFFALARENHGTRFEIWFGGYGYVTTQDGTSR